MREAIQPTRDLTRAWQIYDEHRKALFNCWYFEAKVAQIQSSSLWLDIVTAVGASTTGVAGWALWTEPGFKIVWAGLAGVAGTLAIIKPILKLDDKLVRSTKFFGEHARVSRGFSEIVSDMTARQAVDDAIEKRFIELRNALNAIEIVPQGSERFKVKIQARVNAEWPSSKILEIIKSWRGQNPGR